MCELGQGCPYLPVQPVAPEPDDRTWHADTPDQRGDDHPAKSQVRGG